MTKYSWQKQRALVALSFNEKSKVYKGARSDNLKFWKAIKQAGVLMQGS